MSHTVTAVPTPLESTDPVLVFRNVTISFDGPPVLDDISLSVGPHETRILLGPAGVGKRVLLKLGNGLLDARICASRPERRQLLRCNQRGDVLGIICPGGGSC